MGSMKASFLATFPSIQSAIKVHGTGDGMRVQLEIPESEMGEAVKLLTMREKVLRVNIKIEEAKDDKNSRKVKESYI